MKNKSKSLIMFLAIASLVTASSCNKEKLTSSKIEGKWTAVKFEYPDNYVSDFEKSPNDYTIELWQSNKLSLGPVNDQGMGKISATGTGFTKFWYGFPQEIVEQEINMSDIFYDNYSISEDGKKLQYLNSSNVADDEDEIIKISKSELIVSHKMHYGKGYIKVTYEKIN